MGILLLQLIIRYMLHNKIMDEDFNTPNLITYLLELIKELNTALRNKGEISLLYDKINLQKKQQVYSCFIWKEMI